MGEGLCKHSQPLFSHPGYPDCTASAFNLFFIINLVLSIRSKYLYMSEAVLLLLTLVHIFFFSVIEIKLKLNKAFT